MPCSHQYSRTPLRNLREMAVRTKEWKSEVLVKLRPVGRATPDRSEPNACIRVPSWIRLQHQGGTASIRTGAATRFANCIALGTMGPLLRRVVRLARATRAHLRRSKKVKDLFAYSHRRTVKSQSLDRLPRTVGAIQGNVLRSNF